MSKVILDTNVLVSSLIQRSYPYYILTEIFANNHIELCISEEVFREYYQVLNREKFAKYPEFRMKADIMLANVWRKAMRFFPDIKLSIIKDVDDNKFLELADTCKADFLITGNTNDFSLSSYKETRIVTPKAFWDIYLSS